MSGTGGSISYTQRFTFPVEVNGPIDTTNSEIYAFTNESKDEAGKGDFFCRNT